MSKLIVHHSSFIHSFSFIVKKSTIIAFFKWLNSFTYFAFCTVDIKVKGRVLKRMYTKTKHAKFSEKWTFLIPDTHACLWVSGGKKCLFFGKCGVLYILVTYVLRFSLVLYCRRYIHHCVKNLKFILVFQGFYLVTGKYESEKISNLGTVYAVHRITLLLKNQLQYKYVQMIFWNIARNFVRWFMNSPLSF